MSILDIDSHKLMYHPESVSFYKENGFCYPLHIEIGITDSCNHKCIQCTLDWMNHKTNFIDKDVFFKMIDDASKMGVKSIYFAGEGEPTLHPELANFVKYCYDKNIKVAISSNGALFNKNLAEKIIPYVSWLRFSVDASTKETFAKIHGVKDTEFDIVINNIKNCIQVNKKLGGTVQIGIQSLLMPENISEIEDLAKIAKDIGADNIQVKPAHSHPKSSYQIGIYDIARDEIHKRLTLLNDDKFTAIVRIQSMERLKQERTYKKCHAFNVYCLIDAKGNVTPCNIWYNNEDYIFGNIYKNSLKDIWESNYKKQIIDKITETNHCFCKEYRCRQDVMNRYLERVVNPELNDEFI